MAIDAPTRNIGFDPFYTGQRLLVKLRDGRQFIDGYIGRGPSGVLFQQAGLVPYSNIATVGASRRTGRTQRVKEEIKKEEK
jgi:hypothetical protein